jgi:hypothetical protein
MKQLNCLVKVVNNFLLRIVVGVAVCFKCANASAVFVPFMFPEVGVVAFVVFPIGTHLVEKVSSTSINEDQRDIAIPSTRVAKLIEATVAVIRPE